TRRWGMYGFEVVGFASPADILCPVPPGWLGLTVVREEANGTLHRPTELAPGFMRFDESSAEVWLNDRERIELDRDSMQVRLTTREPVTDDALAHPYLGLPAAVASHWHGRQVLHGGSFLHHAAPWAVLGSTAGGQSARLGL